jgi:hypothetical protein
MDGLIAVIRTRRGRVRAAALPHVTLVNTRIMIRSRLQFEEINSAIEVNDI